VAGARLKDGSCDYLSHQGYVRRTLDANANAESEVGEGNRENGFAGLSMRAEHG
jgi:hypothetical protein